MKRIRNIIWSKDEPNIYDFWFKDGKIYYYKEGKWTPLMGIENEEEKDDQVTSNPITYDLDIPEEVCEYLIFGADSGTHTYGYFMDGLELQALKEMSKADIIHVHNEANNFDIWFHKSTKADASNVTHGSPYFNFVASYYKNNPVLLYLQPIELREEGRIVFTRASL